MTEVVDIERYRRGRKTSARRPAISVSTATARQRDNLFFDRGELFQILSLYSRMVAAGEWRDYAIDERDDGVSFCVFRHAGEHPRFRVVKLKRPKRGHRYLLGEQSTVLAGAETLGPLLRRLERQARRLKVVP